MSYTTRLNLICMVAFDYLLFLLINILSWSIPAWFVILSSILFITIHAVLAQIEQAARLSSVTEGDRPIQRQSFFVECLPVLGITCFFIFYYWLHIYDPMNTMQLLDFFLTTLKPPIAGLMLVQCEQKWADQNNTLVDKLIALIPVLLFYVIQPVVIYYDCFGLLNSHLLQDVKAFSGFILLTSLGMYTAKNGRFMQGQYSTYTSFLNIYSAHSSLYQPFWYHIGQLYYLYQLHLPLSLYLSIYVMHYFLSPLCFIKRSLKSLYFLINSIVVV